MDGRFGAPRGSDHLQQPVAARGERYPGAGDDFARDSDGVGGAPGRGVCSPNGCKRGEVRPAGGSDCGDRASGASGSTPRRGGAKERSGGASLKSPPAALSQIVTEIVSPTAILSSGGLPSFSKRARRLSFGCASNDETTRLSTSI